MGLMGIGTSKKKEAPRPQAATPVDVPKDKLAVTEAAAEKAIALAESEGKPGWFLRVGIMGGGCSGLTYHFSFQQNPDEKDLLFEAYKAKICVDPKSLLYVGGSVLDWSESLMRSGFTVKNPREVKSCSCGESFSL
jgi:iron-sulfur cluster assembly protein